MKLTIPPATLLKKWNQLVSRWTCCSFLLIWKSKFSLLDSHHISHVLDGSWLFCLPSLWHKRMLAIERKNISIFQLFITFSILCKITQNILCVMIRCHALNRLILKKKWVFIAEKLDLKCLSFTNQIGFTWCYPIYQYNLVGKCQPPKRPIFLKCMLDLPRVVGGKCWHQFIISNWEMCTAVSATDWYDIHLAHILNTNVIKKRACRNDE